MNRWQFRGKEITSERTSETQVRWWWLCLGCQQSGRLRSRANKISYGLNVGTTPRLLDRVTKGWSCHQLRWRTGTRRRETGDQRLFYTSCIWNITHQSKNVIKWVEYELGVWEENLNWRHKLGIFVYRMAFESTKDQDLNDGSSAIKRLEKGSSSSRGNGEGRKPRVLCPGS